MGPEPADAQLSIDVTLQPADPVGLETYASEVSSPGSSSFHHYLTSQQVTDRFGPRIETVTAVENALREVGLNPGPVSANRLSIPVTASAARLSAAFAVSFQQYLTPDGRTVYANSAAPKLPASIAADVQGIIGLDNLYSLKSQMRRPTGSKPASTPVAHVATGGPQPCGSAQDAASTFGTFTFDQFASMYSFSDLYGKGDFGAGQTIAVIEIEPYLLSDISAFDNCYGISTHLTNYAIDGGVGVGAGEGEDTLDIEIIAGLAPRAAIEVFESPAKSISVYDSLSAAITQDAASVISVSLGACEAHASKAVLSAENTIFQEAAAQGQSVVVSSGDSGSEGCSTDGRTNTLAVSDPGSQPFVTGVGGTAVVNPTSPPAEVVWNDAYDHGGAGGGGLSTVWGAPFYQKNYLGATGTRQVPDVSADADTETGYTIYHKGDWTAIGGTSASAPLWGALLALTDAECTQAVGFANPAIYYAFSPRDPVLVGNDILADSDYPDNVDNDYTGTGGGQYPVLQGYDLATGLGSPRAGALAGQLCAHPYPLPQVKTAFAGDFNNDGRSDVAVYRPSNGLWLIRGITTIQWGRPGDIPVVGDFNGDRRTDLAVYRPSTGTWLVRGGRTTHFGAPGDVPVVGDFNGDHQTDLALFRPSTSTWYIGGGATVRFGAVGDIPVVGDYNHDGRSDIAVYRPSTGVWYVYGMGPVAWGRPGDVPVVGDFNGDGRADITVFRPSTSTWIIRGIATIQWGKTGDMPVIGDFNGDHHTDTTVFRPSNGLWLVRGIETVQWGRPADQPV